MNHSTAKKPSPVSFAEAFRFWLQLGFISFGGPAGQIAIMHRELVEKRRWVSEKRFLHALNFCMVLPGPEAQQLATYLGWLMHRTWGGVVAGSLFFLPSLVLLIALSWVYMAFGEQPLVAGIFYGIKPAVAAIVLHALHRIATKSLGNPMFSPVPWAITAMSFIAIWALKLPFPLVVLSAMLTGAVLARIAPGSLAHGKGHASANPALRETALIDDDTPTPPHALFSLSRLAMVLLAGAALWLLPMAALFLTYGWSDTLTQIGWFFTKAALLTFGGAYAVLPYVNQMAVEHYQWLSTAQMMDGLALGETTPGPLIMVVAFVGFVGGWAKQVLGPEALFLGAAVAACVATWFTFLPSFIFILAGGPWVESTRDNLKLTAPLAAVTAAVVGVIANLALFFIAAVAYPVSAGSGFDEKPDAVALTLVALAALALWRLKWGVISVIAASAAAGLALRLLGWA
ncbi:MULTISPECIES: chromate efflux transporter [unclassified Polaromonas]|uniref:chromate efflux transporter n=1 Tax=unclassified Polaromonas TaxID=2638319 RepID=UPI0018CAAB0C|nr:MULTISPECIES: chromate efflux transporter [unclassified Polaromonas]MBG6071395.1 chromate transporter [Polaromonas sp. CG_9.7]MBG6113395.1 chromate transporter [Polaromonas sp. CG_9.2]MDH6183147.1 chromate transporter [Polaromonas sp. CG_23.6]